MRVINSVVVFDRGGLIETESWVRVHETVIEAVEKINPHIGNNRGIAQRGLLRSRAHETPDWKYLSSVTELKSQFLANLASEARRKWGSEDLRAGLGELARSSGNLLMVEYPSRQFVDVDDEDFGPFLQREAGDFDAYVVGAGGLRFVVKMEDRGRIDAIYSISRLAGFMKRGLLECGVLVLVSLPSAENFQRHLATWEEMQPFLSVWRQIGFTVERGSFIAIGIC